MKQNNPQILLMTLLCAIFFLILLNSCGRNNDNDETYDDYTPNNIHDDGEPQTFTLTMASPDHFEPFIQQAARMLHSSIYQESGNTFNLELTTYTWAMRESHMQRFRTMMMAGEAYDLFVVDRHPIRAFTGNGLIIDIYDLIDQDPAVSRDDFFTNVLEAFEYQGQLISIPLKFGFTYVGINSTLPQVLIDRFSQYETISYKSLLNLYRDLRYQYPGEFDHLVFAVPGLLDHFNMFEFAINDYIDFATRTAHLSGVQFVDFLESFHLAASHSVRNWHDFRRAFGPVQQRVYSDERVDLFVFNTIHEFLHPWEALFELDAPPFAHYIPVTDSSDRLLIYVCTLHCASKQIAVSAGADQALAWELIKNLITVVSCVELRHAIPPPARYRIGSYSLKTSIETNQFVERAESAFWRVFSRAAYLGYELFPYVGQGDEGARQQQISNAIARLERYNDMPVMRRHYLPDSIWSIYEDFILEIITPEDAAQRFQNTISLWLIE